MLPREPEVQLAACSLVPLKPHELLWLTVRLQSATVRVLPSMVNAPGNVMFVTQDQPLGTQLTAG